MRRQAQVEQNDLWPLGTKCLHCAWAISGHRDFVIVAERPFHLRANEFVIVNDQKLWFFDRVLTHICLIFVMLSELAVPAIKREMLFLSRPRYRLRFFLGALRQ